MKELPLNTTTLTALAETKLLSKSAIEISAQQTYENLGELNAKDKIETVARLKACSEYVKAVADKIKKDINKDDVDLTGGILGCDIGYSVVNTKYDYNSDIEWRILNAKIKRREKALQDQFKQYQNWLLDANPQKGEFTGLVLDGEVLPVINRTQTDGIKIELGK